MNEYVPLMNRSGSSGSTKRESSSVRMVRAKEPSAARYMFSFMCFWDRSTTWMNMFLLSGDQLMFVR